MLDIYPELKTWANQKRPFAIATVTQTWGSSPRAAGSAMGITADMKVVGSVSGGCIEGAVIEAAQKVLQSGRPELIGFGVSDETAWSVGLTCGGKVAVFVEPHISGSADEGEQAVWQAVDQALAGKTPGILATRLSPEKYQHMFVNTDGTTVGDFDKANHGVIESALAQYSVRSSAQVEVDGEPVFLQVLPRKDRLIIIGAAHISIALVRYARELNFEVIVIDPRQIFGSTERFPLPPHQLLNAWPDEVIPSLQVDDDTYAVLLSHDPKIDDPALHLLLRSAVRYIGALGSRRTHAKRCSRLEKAGFSQEEIAAIHGPAGLDINANTPDEIALSIIAQIIEVKRRRG